MATKCCICIPLGAANVIAFIFAIFELAFAVYAARCIQSTLHLWLGIVIILVVVKIAPIVSFMFMGMSNQNEHPRKTSFKIYLMSQIIEGLLYTCVLAFDENWKEDDIYKGILIPVYCLTVPLKIAFCWATYRYWKHLVDVHEMEDPLLSKDMKSVIY